MNLMALPAVGVNCACQYLQVQLKLLLLVRKQSKYAARGVCTRGEVQSAVLRRVQHNGDVQCSLDKTKEFLETCRYISLAGGTAAEATLDK